MLVRDRMSRKVVGVTAEDAASRAQRLMRAHGIRHLPVLRRSRLIGILSDRDLRNIDPERPIQDVMTLGPISIAPDASVDEAALLMHARKISSLPVVEKARVVGFLTTTDVLKAFVDLSGAAEATTRLILTGWHGRGVENTVRHIVHDCRGELKWMHRAGRRLHLRVKIRRIDDLVTKLEAAGFDVIAVTS